MRKLIKRIIMEATSKEAILKTAEGGDYTFDSFIDKFGSYIDGSNRNANPPFVFLTLDGKEYYIENFSPLEFNEFPADDEQEELSKEEKLKQGGEYTGFGDFINEFSEFIVYSTAEGGKISEIFGELAIVKIDDEYYINDDFEDISLKELSNWLYSYNFRYFVHYYEEFFNTQFWQNPEALYHATKEENIESIMQNGLYTTSGTGVNNRYVRGVFTVTNPDLLAMGHYGDYIFEIDTLQMKEDGFMPNVEKEPEASEYAARELFLNMVDIESYGLLHDISDDIWHETVVVLEDIPEKYVRLL